MAEKITYLFGAGASYNALPVVKNFSKRLIDFTNEINGKVTFDHKIRHVLDGLKEVASNSLPFGSIDTYLKYLYLTNRELYSRYKKFLMLYFIIEQIFFAKRDERYLGLITALMEETLDFPENVNFLTWNYDFQFEFAAHNYYREIENKNTKYGQQFLYPVNVRITNNRGIFRKPVLCHLNGIAGMIGYEGYVYLYDDLVNKFENNIDEILKIPEDKLLFAWEENSFKHTLMDYGNKIITDTSILIVIGYSFPFYNRKYDKSLFNLIYNKLKKIYIQDNCRDNIDIKKLFHIYRDVEIIHIKNVERFHIPYEL